jgi:hypothetical protein
LQRRAGQPDQALGVVEAMVLGAWAMVTDWYRLSSASLRRPSVSSIAPRR